MDDVERMPDSARFQDRCQCRFRTVFEEKIRCRCMFICHVPNWLHFIFSAKLELRSWVGLSFVIFWELFYFLCYAGGLQCWVYCRLHYCRSLLLLLCFRCFNDSYSPLESIDLSCRSFDVNDLYCLDYILLIYVNLNCNTVAADYCKDSEIYIYGNKQTHPPLLFVGDFKITSVGNCAPFWLAISVLISIN